MVGAAGAAAAAACNCTAQPECDPFRSPRIEVLHEEGRIFLAHNFLTDEECDHIIQARLQSRPASSAPPSAGWPGG